MEKGASEKRGFGAPVRHLKWSPIQQEALETIVRWSRSSEQVFYLAGYAGTGKTELARHMAEEVGGRVLYGAFTGKAAYVLRRRGCSGATTIHKLIYVPKERSRQRLLELQKELTDLMLGVDPSLARLNRSVMDVENLIREEKENLKRPSFSLNPDSPVRQADLLVIDEVSMVDERMGEDLLSFGVKVLVIGDPFQLPPVRGAGYFTKREPDMMLTEIHRQARDNPIIELATKIRSGEDLEYGEYGDSVVMDWADVDQESAMEADQILVGTNNLRRGTNQRMRELLGHQEAAEAAGQGRYLPVRGDRLVCLRNDHREGLLNGAIWAVDESTVIDEDYVQLEIAPEDEGDPVEVVAHVAPFRGEEVPHWDRRKAQEFDYGYALTVHKAQGSQWGHVLLFDQSRSFKSSSRQWLYTGITRASDRVTIVR